MKDRKCILMLYKKGVNDKPVEALKEYFEKAYHDCFLVAIDDENYLPKLKAKRGKSFKVFSMRNMSGFYDKIEGIFGRTSGKKAIAVYTKEDTAKPVEKKKIKKSTKRLRNALNRFEPNLVVCLNPQSLKLAIKAREEVESTCKIYAFNTNYGLNKGFVIKGCDGFLVQNADGKTKLMNCTVDEKIIKVVDAPLPRSSYKKYDKGEVCAELGIIDFEKPIYVIVGGRYGCSQIKPVYNQLVPHTDTMNIVVVTGGNASLEKYLQLSAKNMGKTENIYIVKKIDEFPKLYSIADVVISSPTMAITYEAMARGIPCILLKPIGMAERANYNFLTTKNLCRRGADKELLALAFDKLQSGEQKKEIKEKIDEFININSVVELAEFLHERAKGEESIKEKDEKTKAEKSKAGADKNKNTDSSPSANKSDKTDEIKAVVADTATASGKDTTTVTAVDAKKGVVADTAKAKKKKG